MSHPHIEMPAGLYKAYADAESRSFHPRGTVRCAAFPMFRCQLARNLACLLDVDPSIAGWLCLPTELNVDGSIHVPDFLVTYEKGASVLLDAVEKYGDPSITETAAIVGYDHRFVDRQNIEEGFRLQNARDLLRYASYRTPLNDRVRLLAALDEAGSVSVGECLHIFREVPPMTAISSMILHRFIEADLDTALIGPETVLRRFQR